ncbi:hypothetical protein EDD27_8664 [Nonomuraea polychroma]|uniref:Uncharacterized protein n=1 Tax=Nonomuraea polychroma TaxID=46176 RepID=A0A438MIV4_9ACTN|nr:hypothetical protein EDD27_8664 [Nonomuraea polychroma]
MAGTASAFTSGQGARTRSPLPGRTDDDLVDVHTGRPAYETASAMLCGGIESARFVRMAAFAAGSVRESASSDSTTPGEMMVTRMLGSSSRRRPP